MIRQLALTVLLAAAAQSAPPGSDCGVCPFIERPVCGSNLKTYSNECAFNCAKSKTPALVILHQGNCPPSPPPPTCLCPQNYKPICGTDGNTYSNECMLSCNMGRVLVEKAHDGPCSAVHVVDAAAVQTEHSGVKVEDAAATIVQVADNSDPCSCTRNYKPVCGSNGETYNNECLLNCVAATEAMARSAIAKVHDGPCGSAGSLVQVSDASGVQVADASIAPVAESSADPCTCTRSYKPVCGSNGETYNNECLLNCVAATEAMARSAIAKVHDGPCGSAGSLVQVSDASGVQVADASIAPVAESSADPCTCTRSYKPVCGTNGETYNNVCLLNCVAATSSSGVALKHVGPCGSHHVADISRCDCGRELETVCGSNGVLYSNKCLFECANNKNPGIQIVHPSSCSQPRR